MKVLGRNILSLLGLALMVLAAVALILNLPNHVWDEAAGGLVLIIGPIAAWRYGWWLIHLVRANIYGRLVFPRLRRQADRLWQSGWRPPMVHFLMTTYRERPEITEGALASIFSECRSAGVRARIFVATGDPSDEKVIEEYCAQVSGFDAGADARLDTEVRIVRQNLPGKRVAMGLALRAMSRYGVGPEDLAVFLDGDSLIGEGVLEKCAPLLKLNQRLGAVTTDESAAVRGPAWMQSWCDMRFAQRRIAMQSHSLSRKVLTLTGRLSIFRGPIVVAEEFIGNVEADYLDHWLWGRFRFLSGDDKSTWFSLLERGYQMLYVPDATVLTMETIGDRSFERVQQNLMRWSGNMLRNGSRALALGPKRCGWFIWWCVADQRLSIWTSLSGLVMALALSMETDFRVLVAYLVWVFLTRTVVSLVLFLYAHRVSLAFPFLLYTSQVLASVIKVYLVFRISKQRWLNRGDQRAKAAASRMLVFQQGMAIFLTMLYVSTFMLLAFAATGVLTRS
ncbi:MAG: transcriptional regulator [Bryobacterales bacterium]|nr:transcriptional regulator [Bryobacterales bacterium]